MKTMKNSRKALVVDDEASMRDSIRQVLERSGFSVAEAEDGETAVNMSSRVAYDLVLLDLKMPGIDGIQALDRIRAISPASVVVVITGYPTIESAVDAIRRGAADFLPKPFTPDTLRLITDRVLSVRQLHQANQFLMAELAGREDQYEIVGKSRDIRTVRNLVRKVAPTDSTVLITGESGTGKELFARALHNHSHRAEKPFVIVDCCTLVGSLFESELFGHSKGAFTGASATTYGRLELADGGTLFFDEIGNVPLDIQSKLLRLIQAREFNRVGSNQVVKVDVRIIAATNKDLLAGTRQGTFREDLYYRLCVVPVVVPPLRQHREDIPLLVEHFVRKYSRERKRDILAVDDEVIGLLAEQDWPGNVRELENAVERAVILAEDGRITKEDILHYAYAARRPEEQPSGSVRTLRDVEIEHIQSVLAQTNGNRAQAAKQLGIDRKTLWRKLKQYEIEA